MQTTIDGKTTNTVQATYARYLPRRTAPRGIGRAVAGALARAGARVALVKRRDFARLFPRLDADGSGSVSTLGTSRPLVLDTSAIIDARSISSIAPRQRSDGSFLVAPSIR